jgi:NADPH-dependent glutamate synthase beta subunit-like oxidoreductase
MTEEEISFVCGQEVGKYLSAVEILEENDAMVLALGATYPRDLPIPGTVIHRAPLIPEISPYQVQ